MSSAGTNLGDVLSQASAVPATIKEGGPQYV